MRNSVIIAIVKIPASRDACRKDVYKRQKEYCIFNIGEDNSVEKSKILVGEANADDSFIEYSNIYNFAEIYQIDGKK